MAKDDSEELIDGLLDAHVHWDDPDRVAERAAREEATDKRNATILELAYIESGQRGDAPMDAAVAQMAAHFAARIENEVFETGMFTPIHQPLPEIENGGYIAFDIKPVDAHTRVLELRVESPSGEHTASEVLHTGSTVSIVRYLRARELPDLVLPFMEELTKRTSKVAATAALDAAHVVETPYLDTSYQDAPIDDAPTPAPDYTGPRAQTSVEMSFYASLQTCPECKKAVDPAPLKIYGDHTAWTLAGPCSSCGYNLFYPFRTKDDNPIKAPVDYRAVCFERSEILAPRWLSAEVARIEPRLTTDPTHFALADWQNHREAQNRFETCATELARFFPEGVDTIPDALLSNEDRMDRELYPRRYSRAWVTDMQTLAERVSQGIIADLDRYSRLYDAAEKKRKKQGVDWIEREDLQAHEEWIERGRKGKKGRLTVVGAKHEAMKIGRGVNLTGAEFYDTELPDVYLMDAKLEDAELVDTSLIRGKLYGAMFTGATLRGGSMASSDLETADFSRATIDGTDFTGAELHLTTWDKAKVSNATFASAEFGDATLDGAVFRDCDFRGAVFSADDADSHPTTHAKFERCDLRDTKWDGRDLSGATFVDCKLAGISGAPLNAESAKIKNADLSTFSILQAWRRPAPS